MTHYWMSKYMCVCGGKAWVKNQHTFMFCCNPSYFSTVNNSLTDLVFTFKLILKSTETMQDKVYRTDMDKQQHRESYSTD